MPMVMNAQITAAKADAIWLRAVEFMVISLFLKFVGLGDERSDGSDGRCDAHADSDESANNSGKNRCDLVT